MSKLFEPLRVGTLKLPNRVVMAPLGRARADAQNREPTRRGIAYLHLIEPVTTPNEARLADALAQVFRSPLILCGGFDRPSAERALNEERAALVAFGAGFIANPDLVERLRRNAPWNTPDPATFYVGGDRGYVDYPFLPPLASGAALSL